MPILLEDLIERLPSDTEEKVKKARDRFNNRIREALRGETRFYFRRRAGSNSPRDETIAVTISIEPGLPEVLRPIEKQSIDDKHRLSLLLAPYRHTLASLRDSSKDAVEKLIPTLQRDSLAISLLDGREKHLSSVSQYADALLKKLNEFELTKFILQVNSDVLGVYHFGWEKLWDNPEPKIELYWGVIGLIARDLGLKVEDLTCVVLTHELAHAFSHVGTDADDHRWNTNHFAASAVELKEGLAQYYSQLVCERLRDEAPGAIHAYQTLLPHQQQAYRVHQNWKDSNPEHVRLAMLEARRFGGPVTLVQFAIFLRDARKQLRQVADNS
jgi:hypothetical protein